MRIEELKDILASRSGVYGENIALSDMYGVLEDYDALCAELAERDEQHRRIMAEECAPDERHCTCVPALRAEVARLRAKVRELEDIPTCPVCGEPMTRRNADGTLGCNLCYALDGDA